MPSKASKDHFLTLDGMRGIAATAVVAHHGYKMLWPSIEEAHPWLAVDFFFCLSGFVIAHAYGARISDGMSMGAFIKLRLQRLGPLFLLGMTLGLCVNILQVFSGKDDHKILAQQAMVGIVGFLGLPAPPIFGLDKELYPLNGPAWSLMFECLANIGIALVWRKGMGTTRNFLVWLGLAFIAMLAIAFTWHRLEWGWNWTSIAVGFVRISWSFPLGVLLYRFYETGRMGHVSIPAPLLFVATTALLVTPTPSGLATTFELFAATVAFPILVLFGANASAGPGLRSIENWLGSTSYALYITHYPLFLLYGGIVTRIAGAPIESLAPWAGLGLIVFTYAFAWLACRFYDVPLRRKLSVRRRDLHDSGVAIQADGIAQSYIQ